MAFKPLSRDRTGAGKECRVFLLGYYFLPDSPVPWVDSLPSSSAISLDKLLDAGLYTGEVTEIVGVPGSGKTQVIRAAGSQEDWGR